jgi:hypothetical protein
MEDEEMNRRGSRGKPSSAAVLEQRREDLEASSERARRRNTSCR